MASRTIEIKLRTVFDAAGAKAAAKAMAGLAAEARKLGSPATGNAAKASQAQARAAQAAAQAATAQARAAAAQARADEQAARASTASAIAQQRLARETAQAEAAQARAAAAAQRLAQQQERMARSASGAANSMQPLPRTIAGLSHEAAAFARSAVGMIGALASIQTAVAVYDFASVAAANDAARQSFDSLAASAGTSGDALLAALNEAAGGAVSNANIIKSANTALLLLGSDVATQLPRLLEIAKASAATLGTDVGQVFDSLVTGISRNSIELIDNAGITIKSGEAYATYAASIGKSVDALSAAERQQAILNAVLTSGQTILDQTAGVGQTTSLTFQQFEAALANLTSAAGLLVATGLEPIIAKLAEAAGGAGEYIGSLLDLSDRIEGVSSVVAESGNSYQEYLNQVQSVNQEVAQFAQSDPATVWFGIVEAIEPLAPLAYEAATALRENGAGAAEVAAAMERLEPVQAAYVDALGMAQSQGGETAAIFTELEGKIYSLAAGSDATQTSVLGLISSFREGDIGAQQLRSGLDILSAAEMQLSSATDATRSQVIAAIQAFAEKRITSEELISILQNLRTIEELVAGATADATAETNASVSAKHDAIAAALDLATALTDEAVQAAAAGVESQILALRNQELMSAAQAAAAGSGSLQSAAASLANQFGISEAEAQRLIAALRQLAALGGVSQKGGAGYTPATKEQLAAVAEANRLARAAASGGGRGGGGGAGRSQVSEAQKTADQLTKIQSDAAARIEEINQQAADKLVEIDRRAAEERARIAQELQDTIAQSAADAAFEREANDLEAVGETDEKRLQAIQARERAEQEAAQRTAQLQQETLDRIAAGEVEAAEANYEAQQQAINDRQALDEEYYRRQAELAGDPALLAELETQYQEAVAALEARTQTELAIEQAKIDAKKAALEEEKAAVIANAQEQTAAVVTAAQEQAARVAGASAEQAAAVSAALAQQSAAASDWASAVAAASDRAVAAAQRAAAAIAAIPSPSAGGGGSSGSSEGGGVEARAMGGPIKRGQPYLVGERGPELVIPEGNGTVIPSNITQQIISRAQGAGREAAAAVGAGPATSSGGGSRPSGDGGPMDADGSGGASPAASMFGDLATMTEEEAAELERYQKAIDATLDTLRGLADVAQAAAAYELSGPIDPAIVQAAADEARRIVDLMRGTVIPLTEEDADSLDRYFGVAADSIGILADIAGLRDDLGSRPSPIPLDYIQELAEETRIIGREVGRYLANPPAEALAVLERYQDAVERSVSILSAVADLRGSLDGRLSPIPLEVIRNLAAETRLIGQEVGRYLADPPAEALRTLINYQDAVERSVSLLLAVANLRKEVADIQGPIPVATIARLAQESVEIGREVGRRLKDTPGDTLAVLGRYQEAVERSVELLITVSDLRKEAADIAGPIPVATIVSLADEARRIVDIVRGRIVVRTQQQVDALNLYAEYAENAIGILSAVAGLRDDAADLSGPIPIAVLYSLADEAKRIVDIVRGRILLRTQEQVDALSLYAQAAEDSISILNAVADLRSATVDMGPPLDPAMITRLADDAKRITQTVQGRLVPVTEAQAEQLSRYADAAGSSADALRSVADLSGTLFADYISPSDAQLNLLATDAQRIVSAVERAARIFSTEGLEKAALYADTVGNTFDAFKGGLLFFDALNSGDFALDPAKLATFEKSTSATLDTLNRLGAKAATIPQSNLAALQSATAALSGQAEALIRLAAVPFDNLGAISGAFSGAGLAPTMGGGGAVTINMTVNAAPGMDTTALANQVIRQLNTQIGARR